MAVTIQTREGSPPSPVRGPRCRVSRRGFTIIDILVSMSVIVVLISLLLPSLAAIRETTRKVVCASNVRQVGLGIMMYAQDTRDVIPYSRFAPNGATAQPKPGLTMKLRIVTPTEHFDGLGRLFAADYLPAPGVFYCPSHTAEHRIDQFQNQWASLTGEIYGNYQYRGAAPNGQTRLPSPAQRGFALVTDGLTQTDFNHKVGSNVLLADMSLAWFEDQSKQFLAQLPVKDFDAQADQKVRDAWIELDAKLGTSSPPPQP